MAAGQARSLGAQSNRGTLSSLEALGNMSLGNAINRRSCMGALIGIPVALAGAAEEWVDLFDGHSLNGWQPSENKGSWKVVDGMLAASGPRSHLFYQGPVRGADFRNFELEVEVITRPECNSGVYFHTAYQETGFPEKGFEIQINNTALGDNGYRERKKTGSLYGIRNMYKQLVPDDKPFRMNVAVRGKNVQIRLNDQLLVDYVEPTPPVIPAGGEKQRFLDHGTFALQCHNDGSRAFFRKVRVRPLSDALPAYIGPPPVVDDVYREVINIGRHNVPMVDFHVYLQDGMTLEDALQKSRKDGIQYGITTNSAGVSDAAADRWLQPLEGRPLFFSLSITDRDWRRSMSQNTARRFDCILADARRLAGVPAVQDKQSLLDTLVAQTVERLGTEPVDIYAFPTYLPASLHAQADELWTAERRSKLIEALLQNKVAIELNTTHRLPSKQFILEAKAAGCKFAFGSGNRNSTDLRRCEYGLQMTEECKLEWQNFYTPGNWWPKAADRRWTATA